jgi:competence protein ComEC
MRTRIVAFLLGNISLLYWPLDQWPLSYCRQAAVENSNIITLFSTQLTATQLILLSSTVILWVIITYKHFLFFIKPPSFFLLNTVKSIIASLSAFLFGFIGTAFYITHIYPELDLGDKEGKTIEVKGYVDSIPHHSSKKQSFQFVITAINNTDNLLDNNSSKHHLLTQQSIVKKWDPSFSAKVKLSWYYFHKPIKSGQYWSLKVRLKKPNGLLNGSFDYEKWLYQNRFLATGYVRQGYQLKEVDTSFGRTLANLRQTVSDKMDNALLDHPYKGLIKALVIGVKNDINEQQWQILMRTGTNHLLAISGLHIGLLSAFIWFLIYHLWRFIPILNLRYPASLIASFVALSGAIIYAALAGFALPTQRALIMLVVVFIAILLKRQLLPSYILLFALLAVVLFDPLSALSAGFWLSFSAVAVIFFVITARLGIKVNVWSKIHYFIRLQLTIFIGLLAPLLLLFQQFSLIAPLANLVAVPLMSFIIVPLTLFATLFLLIEPIALFIWQLLIPLFDGLFWILAYLSQLPVNLIYLTQATGFINLLVIMGSLWLLMPRGWHGRWLGGFLILPAFFVGAEKIAQGQVKLTVLDVGQGLSMVLRTQNHTLIYDTGDNYQQGFNMADTVIIPYLRAQGIHTVNKLIISHSDRDHSGSYEELLQQIPINDILAGEPEKLNIKSSSIFPFSAKQCVTGQQWIWDDVHFEILSPKNPLLISKKNNHSCVLSIRTGLNHHFLLTGDIEKKIEKQLIKDYPSLKVDVLQVPHHGSNTSSSSLFLTHLEVKIALFSFGYRNRFHHPNSKVVARYKKKQIKLYNTGNGTIDIKSNITNNSFSVKEYRVENQRLWHREIKPL